MSPKANLAKWEVVHLLYTVSERKQWPLEKLISAAREAEIHLSGWPIGVVLDREDAKPKARKFGIRASIKSHLDGMFDYWEFHKDGKFYFLRTLEESVLTYDGKPAERPVLHFDTRIRRTAEALLHCQKLYQTLEVDPKYTIHFKMNYFGLNGRTLEAGERGRLLHTDYKCEEDTHEFLKVCSIDLIAADLKGIVYEATKSLFELFNWFSYSKKLCEEIVDRFLKGR